MEVVFLWIVNIIVIVLLAVLISYWVIAPIFSAPFLTSKSKDIITLFEMAQLGNKDRFIDLGSGEGRVVLEASKLAKESVGVEQNPLLHWFAKLRAAFLSNGPLKLKNQSYASINLAAFDVIYLYLDPNSVETLSQKIEKECSPGTRVLSNKYSIKGWKARQIKPRNEASNIDSNYYLYVIGEHQ